MWYGILLRLVRFDHFIFKLMSKYIILHLCIIVFSVFFEYSIVVHFYIALECLILFMLFHIVLHCIILSFIAFIVCRVFSRIILYYIIILYIGLYCVIFVYLALWFIFLFRFVLNCIILFSIISFSIFYVFCHILLCSRPLSHQL